MQGEIVRFRKKLFGGFNRDDVTEYIAKMARDRDEKIEAIAAAERELQRSINELVLIKETLRDRLTLETENKRLKGRLSQYEDLIEKLRNRASREHLAPPRGKIVIKRKNKIKEKSTDEI